MAARVCWGRAFTAAQTKERSSRCSAAQIASILERKESTVRSDLRRGRMQLKEILKEAYDFGPEL